MSTSRLEYNHSTLQGTQEYFFYEKNNMARRLKCVIFNRFLSSNIGRLVPWGIHV